MAPMHSPEDRAGVERRLVDLEVKLAFTEDLVDRLNEIVTRQQGQLDLLLAEVRRLRQVAAAGEPGSTVRSLRDELPPHY
jgi:SlyX protein